MQNFNSHNDRNNNQPRFFSHQEYQRPADTFTGRVKWFKEDKGYGFIVPDDGARDVFVHIRAVQRSGLQGLAEGQKVQFELVPGKDGKFSAERLKVI